MMLSRHRNILSFSLYKTCRKSYHGVPFFDFYEKVTDHIISDNMRTVFKKRHPNIEKISRENIECVLQILAKFGINAYDACSDPHVFSMNPISMDNYGEILKECCFSKIIPKYIIRYHTIVRSTSIADLKKEGLLKHNLNLEGVIQNCFTDWPENQKVLKHFSDSSTSIYSENNLEKTPLSLSSIIHLLQKEWFSHKGSHEEQYPIDSGKIYYGLENLPDLTVRTSVLENYLKWRLSITEDEFKKFCRNYLPLRHRPMCDINEALNIAQNEIRFNTDSIRRNGFIISSDPMNTKLIIENVDSLAGYDIRDAIRNEPAILKNNYNSLLEIKQILKDNGVSEEAQRRCLRVYCMRPQTVKERLDELKELPEYQILSTNPRVLSMVVHKRKMMSRLEKIQSAKKQCYSLNHLISSKKVFNNYISSFGDKVCGRDIAVLITSSFRTECVKKISNNSLKTEENQESKLMKAVLKQLKRHKYWLHSSLYVINENIQYLNKKFYGNVIVNNCQIVLYPLEETKRYLEFFLRKRRHILEDSDMRIDLEANYNNLNYRKLTDDQILSLVLYEIEKKYHFSGDGIWSKRDGIKSEQIQYN